MNRNKAWVYSDDKEEEILCSPNKFKNLRAFIINNYEPKSDRLARVLKWENVSGVYVAYKLYDKTVSSFDFASFEDFVGDMKVKAVDGIAIDGEAYSESNVWESTDKETAYRFGVKLKEIIDRYKLKTILLPEDLGGDKYNNYANFIDGLNPNNLLTERCYNEYYPWKMLMFWQRNTDKPQVMGIWPDTVPWYAKGIQYITARLLTGDYFYYTEGKLIDKSI